MVNILVTYDNGAMQLEFLSESLETFMQYVLNNPDEDKVLNGVTDIKITPCEVYRKRESFHELT